MRLCFKCLCLIKQCQQNDWWLIPNYWRLCSRTGGTNRTRRNTKYTKESAKPVVMTEVRLLKWSNAGTKACELREQLKQANIAPKPKKLSKMETKSLLCLKNSNQCNKNPTKLSSRKKTMCILSGELKTTITNRQYVSKDSAQQGTAWRG